MNKPILHDPLEALLVAPSARHSDSPVADLRPADVEMARVLKTVPLRMASDPSNGAIAHWKHGALHDVVEPMTDHVIMTYPTGVQRLERRTGKSVAIGTARSGAVTIIPAGSSARWDIPGLVDVIQLYLPHTTFEPIMGGLSPHALRRAIERLGSDSGTDVSLTALASDAGLSRFHFCRAFKESTGLSPHAWLRQQRLEQAMNMLRDTDASIASVAAQLGYASQTAFTAAFKKLTGETPSDWRRPMR